MQISSPVSKTTLWISRVMSALPVLLVLLSSVMKLMKMAAVVEGFARAGLSERLIIPVGVIELVCVIVYVIPQTAVLGAILMKDCSAVRRSPLFALATRLIQCQSYSGCWRGEACFCGILDCES